MRPSGVLAPLLRALVVVAALGALVVLPSTARAHAVVTESSPAADARLDQAPPAVTIAFTEPIQLLRPEDAEVVDADGRTVSGPARVSSSDSSVLEIPIAQDLADGTYTVRYTIIGADSHVIPGVRVFGVGSGELGDPYLKLGSSGPSETGGWGVSSRLLQLVTLGGLIGLLAFRWFVWAPVARARADPRSADGAAVLSWGRDLYWFGFGVLSLAAMVAEGYLLVVQSARALGISVFAALGDSAGIGQVLSDTDFGALVQLRGALLFGVFALGIVIFIKDYGSPDDPESLRPGGGVVAPLVLGGLLLAVLGGLAAQGHPRIAAIPALQVGAQLAHVVAVAVWVTGLALVAIALIRLPRVARDSGRVVCAALLIRFSTVALVAVGVAVATGLIRTVAELGAPEELWTTAYGRSIVYKLVLLAPIAVLALVNRRTVTALRGGSRAGRVALERSGRLAAAELALCLLIVGVASLLVAQVPGS